MFIKDSFPSFLGRSAGRWSRGTTAAGCLWWQLIRHIARDHMRTIANRHASIEMFVNDHGWPGQGVSPTGLIELKRPIGYRNRIVVVNDTLILHAKDPVQVLASDTHERTAFLRRRHRKFAVEFSHVTLAEKLICLLQVRDAMQSQLLR